MQVIAPYTVWARSFSSTNGNENTPSVARQLGLKIAANAWISSNQAQNTVEISNLIAAANAGLVDVAIVGSEAILRNDVTVLQLIAYMQQVRQAIPSSIPVTTADVWGTFIANPSLIAASDVVFGNFYPYWEGTSISNAMCSLQQEYQQLVKASGSKTVVISETGWPSAGNAVGAAVPTVANANLFALQFLTWAHSNNIQSFYFEAFDEDWKVASEGPQGANWGLWDENASLKAGMGAFFNGEQVSYHVFLPPASSIPANGFPVIIYGHGLDDNQFGAPTYVASTWAKKGFATLALEIVGHGFGSGSTTVISEKSSNYTVATPGRGIQFIPSAPIGSSDGCILPGALATRDCSRQTALDLSALVEAIRATGLGLNLDPSRIYYVGQSFGSFYGTLFEAVEPGVSAGTLNVGGGTQTDAARLSPIARLVGAFYLSAFMPSLLNVPPAAPQAYFHDSFNDQYVYPGQVVIASVPGALAIQAAFEQSDWLGMIGDPLSFAPHLQTSPLAGVPAKPILMQFGLGDLEVPNPTESALVRAGDLGACRK